MNSNHLEHHELNYEFHIRGLDDSDTGRMNRKILTLFNDENIRSILKTLVTLNNTLLYN